MTQSTEIYIFAVYLVTMSVALNDLKRIWMGTFMTQFKELCWHLWPTLRYYHGT